jgi:hypothetical protein
MRLTSPLNALTSSELSRSAPGGASCACALAPLRGAVTAFGGAPGAFRHGIVKNQQGSATELWQTKARENSSLLNF